MPCPISDLSGKHGLVVIDWGVPTFFIHDYRLCIVFKTKQAYLSFKNTNSLYAPTKNKNKKQNKNKKSGAATD